MTNSPYSIKFKRMADSYYDDKTVGLEFITPAGDFFETLERLKSLKRHNGDRWFIIFCKVNGWDIGAFTQTDIKLLDLL